MSKRLALAALVALALPLAPARAHCDTLDGPVVKAARSALEAGKSGPVLAWVQPADEAEVKAAFTRALAVRKLGPEAKALADQAFLETVVRLHRAGEGAPYTGLKPAGQDLGPTVPAADLAAASGSPEALERLLLETVRHGLHERLAALRARTPPGDDVTAGRAWVAAYVPYVHWVEGVYQAAAGRAGAHAEPLAEPGPAHRHEGH